MFERSEEFLLKSEIGQFSFLQELHRQLSQRVHHEEGHLFVWETTNLGGRENGGREGEWRERGRTEGGRENGGGGENGDV